ncbi:uncharacterized protein LOC143524594 [Brachyhypopomus gauderio]|uniref:uncharacterized protein LOC143524594 n=1 Tax=Brachyhypopomus gauderio TaxID=698409 RepID=UPI004040F051
MDCGSRILFLIILLHNAASHCQMVTVTCYPQAVCALQGSQQSVKCYYPWDVTKFFWFSPKQKDKWRNEDHPEDVVLDSDYAGRVSYTETTSTSSTLTIIDLRERDSGEYHLMLFAGTGEKYHSSTAVRLTVSALQVKMAPDLLKWNGERVSLTCSPSCKLASNTYIYWYKNEQYHKTSYYTNDPLVLSGANGGRYSCSVADHDDIRSTVACVSREVCWSVSYTDRRVCVVEGSSVEFPCTYSHPSDEKVNHTFWFYVRPKEDPQDLSLEEQFAGRVEFVGDKERSCTLRIRDLRKSDSGEYRFRFSTKGGEKFSGKPGVILIVTDLQVRVSSTPVSEGQTVTLGCSSTCTLSYNPTYIWYKNEQPVTHNPIKHNKLYLESADSGDGLQYSCALGDPVERTELKHITVGMAICLAIPLITGALCLWKRNCSSFKEHRSSVETEEQCFSGPVYDDVSALTTTSDTTKEATLDDPCNVQYSTVYFPRSHTQEASLRTTTRLPLHTLQESSVEYAAVNIRRHIAATQ